MAQTSKSERGKTQIEVSAETRTQLRLLTALLGLDGQRISMAEAAGLAITEKLTQVRKSHRE